eukprot:GHVS01010343.1.p1 GENE.GHVS01010343.1~~GHVS01010343.1.p1  ORF type:complete len:219 (-),score=39.75 GHVS01010343.1:20-676(-)
MMESSGKKKNTKDEVGGGGEGKSKKDKKKLVKKLEKKSSKTQKLYKKIIHRLTQVAFMLEHRDNKSAEDDLTGGGAASKMQRKTAKDIYRLMAKYEKDLSKLSKHVNDVSIEKFSKGCLPAGLIRHVDKYGDPLVWIQRKVLQCLQKANDDLRGTLTAMGSFGSTLCYFLLHGEEDNSTVKLVPPIRASCPQAYITTAWIHNDIDKTPTTDQSMLLTN